MTIDREHTDSIASLLETVTEYDPDFPTDVNELVAPNAAAAMIVGEGVRSRARVVCEVFDFVRSNGLLLPGRSARVSVSGALRPHASPKRRTVAMIELLEWIVRNSPAAPRRKRAPSPRIAARPRVRRALGVEPEGSRGVRAFLSVLTFPNDADSMRLEPDNDGVMETPCDQVLMGPWKWSAPRHADVGDVCFFYYSKRSLKNIARLRRVLEEEGRLTRSLRDFLEHAEQQAAQYAGRIVAYSFVTGRAHSDERGPDDWLDWQSRTLAPMSGGSALQHPVDLMRHRGELPIPHGQTIVNLHASQFQRLLEILADAGNVLDSRLVSVTPVSVSRTRVTGRNWREIACGRAHRFVNEQEVRGDFIDHLLEELKDPGSRIHQEVEARSGGRTSGRADYVVRINGYFVPVEAKLNVQTERDLAGQMRRYLSADAFVAWKQERTVVLRGPCSVRGLVIDASGAYVLNTRGYVNCSAENPVVRRGDIASMDRRAIRSRFAQVLQLKADRT